MKDDMKTKVRELEDAINNVDEGQYAYGKELDMKESELCLMYAMDDEKPHTQKQIHEQWMIPKTTLNTITKQWQKEGYIMMRPIPGKRRELEMHLTEKGKEYIQKRLDILYRAEEKAMEMTLKKYSDRFIEVVAYFGTCLKEVYEEQFR